MSSLPSSGRRVRLIAVSVLACVAAVFAAPVARAADGDTGRVHFMQVADSEFDVFTRDPSPAQRQWMRDHYTRMKTWSPYFDSRLDWYTNAWAYRDAYAIYRTSDRATAHPEWILKDAGGNKLYIPFGCSGGTCPQYAGDIGNPAFRAAWLADARETMARGYKGLYVDDVNMSWRIGDGAGRTAQAIDPRTGSAMSEATWQRYMADFMEEISAAFPDREIVHNAIWFTRDNSDVRRQLRAADIVGLERGFNDAGLTNGDGRWSWRAFAALIDRTHADGDRVLLDANAETHAERLYGLAGYLMVTNGRDLLGNGEGGRPNDWWAGYDVELGNAKGKRYLSDGVWRRDFERGSVFVNEPGEPKRTIDPGASFSDLGGDKRATISLGPAAGAVLLRDGLDPTPAAGSPPAAASAPAPAPTAAPGPGLAPVPTAAGMRPVSGVPHGAQRGRVTVRVRVLRRSGVLRVSGVVRGARSGRVLLSARSASSGRHGARRVARVGRSGRFASRLRVGAGRWHVRADYRARSWSAVTASASRAVTVRR